MQTALVLLISAFQLLTLVSTNPSLPQSFKDSAISIANQAIVEAKLEMANLPASATPTTPPPIVTPVSPTFGAVTTPTPTPVPTPAPVVVDNIPVATTLKVLIDGDVGFHSLDNSFPFGHYDFKVQVLDQFGKSMKGVMVHMIEAKDDLFKSSQGDFDKETLSSYYVGMVNDNWTNIEGGWYTGDFNYIPGTSGSHSITFTSGNLSTDFAFGVN